MKCLTPAALLAAALFSAAAVVPFLPGRPARQSQFAFEADLTSTTSGQVQVFYDYGAGFTEADSTLRPLARSEVPVHYRLEIPPGTYRWIRFDPIDRAGVVTIRNARLSDADGRTVASLPAARFKALNQIQSLAESGGALVATTTPGANDPQLVLSFDPAIDLVLRGRPSFSAWSARAGILFPLVVLILAAAEGWSARSPGLGRRLTGWTRLRPGRALALAAALASLASAYPVLLGRSYVSPNFGTLLLYDRFPTLPGYADPSVSEVKNSDVGAIMWQHVPFSMLEGRALAEGELPLWNRYNSSGSPLLGQGQSMFGDPLHLLVILARGAAWAWDLKYLLAKTLLCLGLGLVVLELTRHLPAALIVAVASAFVGVFVYRVNHPAFFSFCYAPWPLYCWLRAAAADRRRTAGWLGGLMLANLALLASGTVKEAYLILVCVNFSGLCVLLAAPLPARDRWAKLAGAVWAGLVFTLLTAPLWGSFLATLAGARTSYDTASAYQIQPGMMLAFFDEILFRPLSGAAESVFAPSSNFLLLGGLLYFLATLRTHFGDRRLMALAASSLLPLSFAFGLVHPEWIIRMPFLANVAHIDDSFGAGLIVLWAALAGAGFAAAARRLGEKEGRDDLWVAGLLLFSLVFSYFGFRQAVHRQIYGLGSIYSPRPPGHLVPLSPFVVGDLRVLLIALVALGLLARQALRRRRVSLPSGLALALCAWALLWRFGLQAGGGFPGYVVHPGVRAGFRARSAAVDAVRRGQASAPARTVGFDNNLFPGWSGVYGLEGINGPDALMSPYYHELLLASPLQNMWDWRVAVTSADLAAARPFLDFLNVRYYLDLDGRNQKAAAAQLQLLHREDLEVYASPTAWPRAFFTDRAEAGEGAPALMQRILHGDGRPFAVLADDETARASGVESLPGDPTGRAVVPASGYRLTEDSTSFEVDAPATGLAVLMEAYWPGYAHAEVDGRSAPVLRVDHAFCGVPIDSAGLHRITISFRPRRFLPCLELAGLGAVLLLGSAAAAFRRPRPAA
ncbi:MAG TPA: hypothetical protein VHC86_08945 [Opitutaceae bacterium]|nr:hypothetical protein [Opitutaceae bacterium]